MSMKYIRDTYGVPAKRGARVCFLGSLSSKGSPTGTITGSGAEAKPHSIFDRATDEENP